MNINELQAGFHRAADHLQCNYCDARVPLDAEPQMHAHLDAAHGGSVQAVLHSPSASNNLTPTQRDLLAAFAAGQSDKQIANAAAITTSTVRQQKYRFRQKAAQAKLYLAQYQAVFGAGDASDLLAVPAAAANLAITEATYDATVAKNIAFDGPHPQLSHWPKKEAARVCLIARISESFTFTKRYSRQELVAALTPWYADHPIVTRYLVDYGYLARTTDGREYWRIF